MNHWEVPEGAVVDALLFDPLGAATLLSSFTKCGSTPIRPSLLVDIARKDDLSGERLQPLITALRLSGLIAVDNGCIVLTVNCHEALRHAAVLRGVAHAQYRHLDANTVEITLSPPAYPSRLMERLPKQGFSWARLHDTKDSLIELASHAQERFTIVSPFLDDEGLEWVGQLFEASSRKSVEKTLIVRGRNADQLEVLSTHNPELEAWSAKVFTYAIAHDSDTRTQVVETFHAKIIIADASKAYIGSANMNRSSRDFSMECGVIISGPCVKPVAALVETIISIADRWPMPESLR
jgi:phosphatidylserine/phosphatidylglycerophosphate/cardiolipin synthase-like enzyme